MDYISGKQGCIQLEALLIQQSNSQYFFAEWALVFVLLVLSALMSGAEVSYFSLTQADLAELYAANTKRSELTLRLIRRPRFLLGAILITDNVFNIGIAILSWPIFSRYHFNSEVLKIIFQVASVTFVIVLFGEVLPKIYTSESKIRFALAYARPVYIITQLCYPLSMLLAWSTSHLDKLINKQQNEISLQEIKEAIEITTEENT